MNAKGGRKDGMNWKTGVGTHPLLCIKWASQVVLVVKNLPANEGDMGIRSLGGEDLLDESMACLENPMDREASQATVHGVTKSQTRLK